VRSGPPLAGSVPARAPIAREETSGGRLRQAAGSGERLGLSRGCGFAARPVVVPARASGVDGEPRAPGVAGAARPRSRERPQGSPPAADNARCLILWPPPGACPSRKPVPRRAVPTASAVGAGLSHSPEPTASGTGFPGFFSRAMDARAGTEPAKGGPECAGQPKHHQRHPPPRMPDIPKRVHPLAAAGVPTRRLTIHHLWLCPGS
jgi:hypothetical protein